MQGDDDTDVARRRRWAGAALASLVAYVMGQAFAYSPIQVYSEEEITSAIMGPAMSSAAPAGR